MPGILETISENLGPLQWMGELGATGVNAGMQMMMNQRNEALMRESWARDDNAVQRRVKDLQAAGLNPVLAASGAGAGNSGPISLTAPNVSMPSFSSLYAAKIAKNQAAQTEADAARAALSLEPAKLQSDVATWQRRLVFDPLLNGSEMSGPEGLAMIELRKAQTGNEILNANLSEAVARAAKAVSDSQIAARDNKILESNNMISTIGGLPKDLLGYQGFVDTYKQRIRNNLKKLGISVPDWIPGFGE